MRKRIWYSPPWFLFWRLNTAIFASLEAKNNKFPGTKKPTVAFFVQGLRQ